jgi:hypothetical protein
MPLLWRGKKCLAIPTGKGVLGNGMKNLSCLTPQAIIVSLSPLEQSFNESSLFYTD